MKEVSRKIFLLSILFLGFFAISFVSAFDLRYEMDRAAYQAQPVLQLFLGGDSYSSYMLFERFLLFLIVVSISSLVLKNVPLFHNQQKTLITGLSIVIAILSVRFISSEWLNTVLFSYQVLGVALTSFFPFLIYLFFLYGVAPVYSAIRKIGWALFICVYFGMYYTTENAFYGQVYVWTAVVAFLFLLFDGTIRNYLSGQKLTQNMNKHLLDRHLELMSERKKIVSTYGDNPSDWNFKRRLTDIDHELKEIDKHVNRS